MTDEENSLTILVHGYFKGGRDMAPLARLLENLGRRIAVADLPATFGSLDRCRAGLERFLDSAAKDAETIHLVGHSFGGLVIRAYLAANKAERVGRCVFIGTPNRGARLADIGLRFFPFAYRVLKPLDSLVTYAPPIPQPRRNPPPETGIIAGNRNRLISGMFLSRASDGRVEVEETRLDGMTDFVMLPYIHTRIHKRPETAVLVDRFLSTGRFGGETTDTGEKNT